MRYITSLMFMVIGMALTAPEASATQPDPAAYPQAPGEDMFKPEEETAESWRSLSEQICSGAPAAEAAAPMSVLGMGTAAGWSTETVSASAGRNPDAQYLLIDFNPWTLTDEDWAAHPENERYTQAKSRGYCTVTAYDLHLRAKKKNPAERRGAAIKGLSSRNLEEVFELTQAHQALGRGRAGDPYYGWRVFPRSVFKQVNYRSREFHDAPMPFSVRVLEERGIFLHRGGIHHETDSAGCIRLGLCDSMALYDWVGKVPLRVEFRFPWSAPGHR